MYCIKCGAQVNGGDYSCSQCGMVLNNSPLARMQAMIDQDKELKQKMDDYSAKNVIEPKKEEANDLNVNLMATPLTQMPQRANPSNVKEATLVTDLDNSSILNPDKRKESLWDDFE